MPESLTNLLADSFDAVSGAQAAIIAILAAVTMRRYGSIVWFSVFAIIVDQFVTIALSREWDTTGDVLSQVFESITELNPTVVITRFIGFLVLITIFYGIKALFRK